MVSVNRLLSPLCVSFTLNIFIKLTFLLDAILCILLRWNLIYILPKLQMTWSIFTKLWRSDQRFSGNIFNLLWLNVNLLMRNSQLFVKTYYLKIFWHDISWKLLLRIRLNCRSSGWLYSPARMRNNSYKKSNNFQRLSLFSILYDDLKFSNNRDKEFKLGPMYFNFPLTRNYIISST